MADRLRGAFAVLQVPVADDGDIDDDALRREVDFCVAAGAHGVVYPVLGSEFQYLTQAERQRTIEVVIAAADGRLPVVAGVAGTVKQIAREYAEHASKAGADAVIGLPPYLSAGTADEIRDYYAAIAEAVEVPVFIQHTQGGMSAGFLSSLLKDFDMIRYIKEECAPSAHYISQVLDGTGQECWGVFAGGHDRWMMSELDRGATGFMPATEAIDVHAQIFEAWDAGDHEGARDLFDRLLPLINLILLLGLPLCKEVLKRRGVLPTVHMRTPGNSGHLV